MARGSGRVRPGGGGRAGAPRRRGRSRQDPAPGRARALRLKAPVLLGAASHDRRPRPTARCRGALRSPPARRAGRPERAGPLRGTWPAAARARAARGREDRHAARGGPLCARAVARDRGALSRARRPAVVRRGDPGAARRYRPDARRPPILLIGAYRSDELAREHPLRRCAATCVVATPCDEIALESLDEDGTAALIADLLGEAPSRPLVRAVHDRAHGLPFFVEELAGALSGGASSMGRPGSSWPRAARSRSPRPCATRCCCARPLSAAARAAGRGGGGRRRGFELELAVGARQRGGWRSCWSSA